MKNRKTFLLLLLFLTIHLAFASKAKKHGSKGDKGGRKGAATYLLKAENGKVYLGSVRKGRKPLRTSPATLVIYGKVLTKNMGEKIGGNSYFRKMVHQFQRRVLSTPV